LRITRATPTLCRVPPPVRAVLFDADGVIQRGAPKPEARLARALGFLPDDLDAFFRDVFEPEVPALTGEIDYREKLEPILARWGAPGRAGELLAFLCDIESDPAMIALIAELRASGVVCGLATNQQPYRAESMARRLGYDDLFDHSFYSCHVGLKKPDERYFEHIARACEIAPGVAAAERVGLQGAHFVHPWDGTGLAAMRKLLAAFDVVAR